MVRMRSYVPRLLVLLRLKNTRVSQPSQMRTEAIIFLKLHEKYPADGFFSVFLNFIS